MKCQIPFSEKNEKNINMSSAEFTQSVLKADFVSCHNFSGSGKTLIFSTFFFFFYQNIIQSVFRKTEM